MNEQEQKLKQELEASLQALLKRRSTSDQVRVKVAKFTKQLAGTVNMIFKILSDAERRTTGRLQVPGADFSNLTQPPTYEQLVRDVLPWNSKQEHDNKFEGLGHAAFYEVGALVYKQQQLFVGSTQDTTTLLDAKRLHPHELELVAAVRAGSVENGPPTYSQHVKPMLREQSEVELNTVFLPMLQLLSGLEADLAEPLRDMLTLNYVPEGMTQGTWGQQMLSLSNQDRDRTQRSFLFRALHNDHSVTSPEVFLRYMQDFKAATMLRGINPLLKQIVEVNNRKACIEAVLGDDAVTPA